MGSKFSYEGMWEFGKRSGKGLAYYNAERTSYYDGEWLNGMRHGYGVLQYKSGNTYTGEWVDNKKCGKGLMEWKDRGETYDGEWEDGKPHGFGVQIWLEERTARTTVSAQVTASMRRWRMYASTYMVFDLFISFVAECQTRRVSAFTA